MPRKCPTLTKNHILADKKSGKVFKSKIKLLKQVNNKTDQLNLPMINKKYFSMLNFYFLDPAMSFCHQTFLTNQSIFLFSYSMQWIGYIDIKEFLEWNFKK